MHHSVAFHGFRVPLIGINSDDCLNECDDCHDEFDTLQMRLNADGIFRCDKCTARNKLYEQSIRQLDTRNGGGAQR